MSDKDMKIDFIGIGPGKSGSTWLYSLLCQHPGVKMSKVKETNFFNDEFHRGFVWYHNLFEAATDRIKIGEISNTYIFNENVASRIYNYNKNVKIISILRNPIERAVSHYFFLKRNGASYASFREAIKCRPDLLERGLYFKHLEPYISVFPEEQLFIKLFDDMKLNTQHFSDDLTRFLDLPTIDLSTVEVEKLKSSLPKSALVAKIVKYAAVKVRGSGFPVIVERIKRNKVMKNLYTETSYDVRDVVTDLIPELLKYFHDDVTQLSRYFGRDIEKIWFEQYKQEKEVL